MVQYTKVNKQDLEAIVRLYEIGHFVDHKVLSGGSENTNYWLKTSKGEYVLTICERKSEVEAQRLAHLLVYLQENDFATSQMVQNKANHWISQWNAKPILLKHYLDGVICEQFTDQQMFAIGTHLAQLHKITSPQDLPQNLGYGIEHFDEVNTHAPKAAFSLWLMEIKAYLSAFLNKELPRALIHADLFYNNIIVHPQREELTIMDFEEATFYYRIYDIGMTLVGTCTVHQQLDLQKAKVLIKAYQQNNPLMGLEKEALQAFVVYAAAATAFWRFVHFNFVEPDEKLNKRYQEMQRLAATVKAMDSENFKRLF